MSSLDLLRRTVAEIDRLATGVADDQRSDPTPCTAWTVRDLLDHIVGMASLFASAAEAGPVPDEETWPAARQRLLAAFQRPGIMDEVVTLPSGPLPGGVALDVAVLDLATHACDLAAATGQAVADADLAEVVLGMARRMITADLRVPGVFGPEHPAADGARAADRLLAFTGRAV